MRRNQLIYGVGLVACVILCKIRPGFVSAMFFYMMLCLPMVDLIMMLITYQLFRVSHDIDKRNVVKGDYINYEIAFENPSMWVLSPIKVSYTGNELLFHESNLDKDNSMILYPFSREKYERRIQCNYRGSYNVGIDKVDIQGYFGLFSLPYNAIETHKILVYPNIYELNKMKHRYAISEANESIISVDKFDKSIFADVRDYHNGDSLNRIHWKLSAKQGSLVTKQYEGNINNKVKLLVNNEKIGMGRETDIVIEDYIVEGVVAMSKYLLDNSNPIEMVWHHYDKMKVMGTKPKDFSVFYEALTRMNFEYDEQPFLTMLEEEARNQYDRCVLMIFTLRLSETLADILLKKQQEGYEVIVVTINPSGFAIMDEQIDMDSPSLCHLVDRGIPVYYMHFEAGMCRLEVA